MTPPPATPTTPSAGAGTADSARRGRWPRRLVRLGLLVVCLATLLWAGWYVYNRGFTRKWREQLTAELRRRGFDFTASRLTLNPFEGLVAEDANLYLLDARHTHLLEINRVAVDINLGNLIQGKSFLNSLDLRGARLTLPVDVADPDGPTLKVRHFDAKLSFLPDEVRVTQAQGDFYGLQISVSGTLLHPDRLSPSGTPATPAERARRSQWARAITGEIEKVRAAQAPPTLDIRFQGDLAQPQDLRAFAQLQGTALQRGSYRLERLLARLDYAAGAFHLRQGELTDERGTLALMGDFDPPTGNLRFQLQSGQPAATGVAARTPLQGGIDLLALAHEFVDPAFAHDWSFRETPRFQLDGSLRLGPSPAVADGSAVRPASIPAVLANLQLTGRVALGHFSYHLAGADRTFDFERGESDFSWNGDRWYLRDLHLVRSTGHDAPAQQFTADVLCEPTQSRIKLSSTVDPLAYLAFLPSKVREAVSRLEFRDPPRVDLTAVGSSLTDPGGMKVDGRILLGRSRYKGVGINRLQGDFFYGNNLLGGKKITLERDEGSVTSDQVVYDFAKHEVRLDNLRSTVDPAQAGVWLDPDVFHTFQPFHFRKPPFVTLHGNVQFNGGRDSHLVTNFNAPGGMDYVFLHKNLPFQSIAGEVVFTEDRLWVNDVRGEIFGGQATGGLNLALGRVKDYTASVNLKNVDFARLTRLYFDYDDSKGKLDASYQFTGRGDDARTLRGGGSVAVAGGNVFSIPFMGPLSSLLGAVVPGLGYDEAHQATANFTTADGKIYTKNLNVRGLGFSLFGDGWLGYADNTMDFRIHMNTRGLPGAVLYAVSKLFEYNSQGPLSKPVWRPRVLSVPPVAEKKPVGAPGSARAR